MSISLVRFHPNLDLDAIREFDQISFNESNLYVIEKYGIEISDKWVNYLQNYWSLTIYLSVVYIILIQIGKRIMSSKQPFQLRAVMFVWNTTIALISAFGSVRTANVILNTWQNHGLQYAVCHPHYYYNATNFWGIIFILSKPFELIDTAFIILRKQNLIFLHWYHHITVMVYVVLSVAFHSVPAIWFCCLNFSVHSFMYSYYALRSLKLTLPRCFPMMITIGQILQMVCGMGILFYVVHLRVHNRFCQISNCLLTLGILLYGSYFVLFIQFFCKSYCRGQFGKMKIDENDFKKKKRI